MTLEEKGDRLSRIHGLKVSADHAPAQDKRVGSESGSCGSVVAERNASDFLVLFLPRILAL